MLNVPNASSRLFRIRKPPAIADAAGGRVRRGSASQRFRRHDRPHLKAGVEEIGIRRVAPADARNERSRTNGSRGITIPILAYHQQHHAEMLVCCEWENQSTANLQCVEPGPR